jgi:hypothetical protein
MAYELWDYESGNLVGRYATQDEALLAVLETVALYGQEAANSLLVGFERKGRHPETIAQGQLLIEQARALATAISAESLQANGSYVKLDTEKPPVASAADVAADKSLRQDSAGRALQASPRRSASKRK